MLKKLTTLQNCKLAGPDGAIGLVKDFYIDDVTWKVRYVAADTDAWLPGRRVLLPPAAFEGIGFGKIDDATGMLRVNLTRRQIEAGPVTDSHRPLPPEFVAQCDRHYDWVPTARESSLSGPPPPATVHLRSTQAVIGYEIHATDGAVGTLVNFMVHERTWTIRELVVQTGHWFNRKTVYLLPENVLGISAETAVVSVSLTREDIAQTMSNDIAQTGAGHL
jgi:hypothetical protein